MKSKRMIGVFVPIVAAVATIASSSVATAANTEGVIVLFDRSGSMRLDGTCCGTIDANGICGNTGFAAPNSRALCGLINLPNRLNPYYSNMDGYDYYFWEFRGTEATDSSDALADGALNNVDTTNVPNLSVGGLNPITPAVPLTNFGDFQKVINRARDLVATTNPVVGGPLTPLAQSYCRAVRFLIAKNYNTKTIWVVSDGVQEDVDALQNANCNGPDPVHPVAKPFLTPIANGAESGYLVKRTGTTAGAQTFEARTNTGADDAHRVVDIGSWMGNMLDVAVSGGSGNTKLNPDTTIMTWPGIGKTATLQTSAVPFLIPNSGPFPTCDDVTDVCTCTAAAGNTCTAAFRTSPQFHSTDGKTTTVLTNIDFLTDLAGSGSQLQSGSLAGSSDGGPSTRAAGLKTTASSTADFQSFLDGLARVTSGRLLIPGSPPGTPFSQHVVSGDVNDDGCVDQTDFNLLKASFGLAATTPAAQAADVSYDGSVNDADYLAMKTNFGTGCSTSPGPIPLLAQVLFGMADLSNWIPTTGSPTLTSSGNHTEGTRALGVSGFNFREFKSVPFATSLIQSVSPSNRTKLVFDLFIPPASNQFYLGEAQLYISCNSGTGGCNPVIDHLYIGNVLLTGKTPNQYAKNLSITLPSNIRTILNQSHPGIVIDMVASSPDTGHRFDNIRFQ